MRFRKILIIRFSSLGDIVLITPLLDALRVWMPDAEVHLLTKERFASLFASDSRIDQVRTLREETLGELLAIRSSLSRERYDLILDAHNVLRSNIIYGTIRSGAKIQLKKDQLRKLLLTRCGLNLYSRVIHQSERYLEMLRPFHAHGDRSVPSLVVPDAAAQTAQRLLDEGGISGRRAVALAPGARWEPKRWPVEHFANVANALAADGYAIVLVGGPADSELSGELAKRCAERPLDTTGRLDLMESAALLGRCRLLVTNDSAPLHMAEAVGTPVIALFGPTARELGYYPQLPASTALGLELRCRPCSRNGSRTCHLGTNECLVALEPERVLEAARTALALSAGAGEGD